jgi:hypothetical protein
MHLFEKKEGLQAREASPIQIREAICISFQKNASGKESGNTSEGGSMHILSRRCIR